MPKRLARWWMSLVCLGGPISPGEVFFFGDISAKMFRFAEGMVGPLEGSPAHRGGGGLVFELASC